MAFAPTGDEVFADLVDADRWRGHRAEELNLRVEDPVLGGWRGAPAAVGQPPVAGGVDDQVAERRLVVR